MSKDSSYSSTNSTLGFDLTTLAGVLKIFLLGAEDAIEKELPQEAQNLGFSNEYSVAEPQSGQYAFIKKYYTIYVNEN